jgi:hypothetical protein
MANDELKNLPPEERIKKLKEIELQKKKEIEEAHKLIKESELELNEKAKQKEKIPIPAVTAIDSKNLSKEEKELFETHRGSKKQEDLEESTEKTTKPKAKEGKDSSSLEQLAKEKLDLPPEVVHSDYTKFLSQKPITDLYSEVTKINRAVEDKGYISREEERRIEYLSSAVERKINDSSQGKYAFNEDTAKAASLIKSLGSRLMDIYHSNNSDNNMYRS